jgi:glycosyltransferase involved in cell wall biosynthesis
MSKRLILFGPLPPPYGGVSVFVGSLLANLKDYDFQMWALYGADATDGRIVRIKHRRLEVVTALRKYAARARIVDFTHFHLEYPNQILLPIWLTAKLTLRFEWLKYICDGSLPERYERFNAVQRRLFKSAVKAVDEFIVTSEALRDWLKGEIKIKQKVTVVLTLLTIPEETLSQPLAAETDSQLAHFRNHRHRVCSIGAFIPDYGFQHVVKAVEDLRKETGADIGLLLLDGAFASDPDFRGDILARRDWITVLTNIPNPQVYQVLRESDLFVRAFKSESYGISRVEAIWCGVPVIATDVGETRGMQVYRFGDQKRLKELMRETLFTADREKLSVELKHWSQQYRQEAETNLKNFIDAVGLSS